ncbi:MAG: rhomboid family intramembrane serine protease [Clostridia bacterium]|nr:rhomboid family intramembrane serine protease [Clostridia bacterium]
MKFVNNDGKNNKWWNKNYFWAISIFYILFNITLFAILGRNNLLWPLAEQKWSIFNGLKELFISLGNAFTHNDWQHVLCNMVAFSFSAFYLERKLGTINFGCLIVLLSLFSSALTSMYAGLFWAGSSVLYFALWGYCLVDFLFSLRKSKKTKTNTIIGAIVVCCLYLGTHFSGFISVSALPIQLIYNACHYFGFIVGIVFALVVGITSLQIEKSKKL